jgi:large subunit ribosomal protein L23
MRDARDIIVRPVVTEKSMDLMADNKYTFIVDKRSNKTEIRNAVQQIFKVSVVSVSTMNTHGHTRRQGRTEGRKPDLKKAIVTLKPGQKIALFEGM